MEEKLAKVRAEIERVKKNQEGVFTAYTDGKFDLCEYLLDFIDSMQEEPKYKFKVGDKVMPKRFTDNECGFYIDNSTRIVDIVGDYYILEGDKAYKIACQDNWELVKEPKFKVGDQIFFKQCKENTLKITSIDESGYHCEDGTFLHFDNQEHWELVEKPTSFDEAIQDGDDVRYNEDLGCRVNLSRLKRVAKKEATGKLKECIDTITEESLTKARKQLQEELVNGGFDLGCGVIWKDEKSASGDLEKVVEEIVDPTVLNVYGVKEIANRLRRTMMDSVSEEQVKESLISKHEDKTCKENGNSLTEGSVSEDMWEASKQYALRQVLASTDAEMSEQDYLGLRLFSGFELAVAHKDGAQWQKQKDESKVLTEEQCRKIRDDAFELGKDAMKQQMMAKAVDATVHIDAGGYPYIPQMELYDYEKDIPFAKEGDKYKVILIKEN